MFKPSFTTKFKKDFKKVKKDPLKNPALLQETMNLLAKGVDLPEKYKDHALIGNYSNHRECHIMSDWLLIYFIDEEKKEIVFVRTGTHSELFKK